MSTKNRFEVHENLAEIGKDGQEKFSKAHIGIIGVGGLGCSVLLQLASLGIGELTIVDNDSISEQNLQRQLLFTDKDIGKSKVEVAKIALKKHQPKTIIHPYQERLTRQNSHKLLSSCQIIVDCTDNIVARLEIDDYCSQNRIALVYGGVKGFKGNVSVFNYKNGKSFKETFPNEDELLQAENCQDSGVIIPVVSTTASLQVMEVVKILLSLPNVLQGKWQVFSLLESKFLVYQLK